MIGEEPGHIRPMATVLRSFELTAAGVPDAENAERCGVAVKTIRRWRRVYRREGRPRGRAGVDLCPRCSRAEFDGPAYAHLLGWYLGDGHITKDPRKRLYSLSIYSDRRYPGLDAELCATFAKVKPGCHVVHRARPGCWAIKVDWTHWPCLFPQHGAGPKHTRAIRLETWQWSIVRESPGPMARGLFHSDGCRITNWTTKMVRGREKRYEYPRYFFANESEDILAICTTVLDLLGISWRRPRRNAISVARREAVAALDEYVGPKY